MLALFLATQDEIGLFVVSAGFGIGFAGLVPAYVLAIRELFPASEASWRVPIQVFSGLAGMAAGAWMGGAIYDAIGSYAPAFAAGVGANLLNLVVVGFLVARRRRDGAGAGAGGGGLRAAASRRDRHGLIRRARRARDNFDTGNFPNFGAISIVARCFDRCKRCD